jgi:hypothetical protein
MNVTLSPPTSLSATRKGGRHFESALAAMPLVRPRYPVDTWTPEDAAAFWVPDYDPDAANALPPMLVLGVAARLVLNRIYDEPLFAEMATRVIRERYVYGMPPLEQCGRHCKLSRNRLVRQLHTAFSPKGTSYGVEFADILLGNRDYCQRKTCTIHGGWLKACLPEKSFSHLVNRNVLVRWADVQWGGIAALFPPLRNDTEDVHVSVQKSRSHVSRSYIPIWVAEGLNRLHRLVPPLLRDLRNTPAFQGVLLDHCHRLLAERLRYWGIRASSPDSAERMKQWDTAFTESCWAFGERDGVYRDMPFYYWGLDRDLHERLCESQDPGLFPVIPESAYKF